MMPTLTNHARDRSIERTIINPTIAAVVRCGERERGHTAGSIRCRLLGYTVVVSADTGAVITAFCDVNPPVRYRVKRAVQKTRKEARKQMRRNRAEAGGCW